MSIRIKTCCLTIPILLITLAGCATSPPVRYAGIDSSSRLTANSGEDADRIPYRYASPVDWSKYSAIIIEPVTLYAGNDHQFGELSLAERKSLADAMQRKFSENLRPLFREVYAPTPGALRLKLTLAGAETTTAVIGTLTKLDPLIGGPYNIVQSVRGKEGLFNGSVHYAVEIYDADSQRLLCAYIAKQYPNAMNLSASFGALGAAEVGIDKGAEELANMLKQRRCLSTPLGV